MLFQWIIVFIFGKYFITLVNCEWIKIDQRTPPKYQVDHFSNKDLNNLKYEDLIELFGPDVKSDFFKFIKQQDVENFDSIKIDKNVSKNMVNEFSDGKVSTTTSPEYSKNTKIIFNDPWAIYDVSDASISKPKTWNGNAASVAEKVANHKSDLFGEVFNFTKNSNKHFSNSTLHNSKKINGKIDSNVNLEDASLSSEPDRNSSKSGLPKMKVVYKLVEVEQMQPFSFRKMLDYLQSIQKTFVFDTTRGISDKVKYLEDFKDKILANIGKCVVA